MCLFYRRFNRVHSGTWKPGKMNFICPGPEIAWNLFQKVRKPGQNKKYSRKHGYKLGMLRYKTVQYYIETIFPKFCTPAILERLGFCLLMPKWSALQPGE